MPTIVIPPIALVAAGAAFVLPRAAKITGIVTAGDDSTGGPALLRNGATLLSFPGPVAGGAVSYCLSGLSVQVLDGDSLKATGNNITLIFD